MYLLFFNVAVKKNWSPVIIKSMPSAETCQLLNYTKQLKFMSERPSSQCDTPFFARESGWPGIYANERLCSLAKNMIGFPTLISHLTIFFFSSPLLCLDQRIKKNTDVFVFHFVDQNVKYDLFVWCESLAVDNLLRSTSKRENREILW